jgi:glucosamine-phosphate N-acetyltransferase
MPDSLTWRQSLERRRFELYKIYFDFEARFSLPPRNCCLLPFVNLVSIGNTVSTLQMGTEQVSQSVAVATTADPIESQQSSPRVSDNVTTETDETITDTCLFDADLLTGLDYSSCSFNPTQLDDKLLLRPLRRSDYHRGYLQLLQALTDVGSYSFEQFSRQFDHMRSSESTYFVTVVYDRESDQVIGSSTLLLERKFIHGCSVRGRMEDVVVNEQYRKHRIGSLLIETVRLLAKHFGVYKLSLDCKDEMIPYYERLGYSAQPGNSNTLVIRF